MLRNSALRPATVRSVLSQHGGNRRRCAPRGQRQILRSAGTRCREDDYALAFRWGKPELNQQFGAVAQISPCFWYDRPACVYPLGNGARPKSTGAALTWHKPVRPG